MEQGSKVKHSQYGTGTIVGVIESNNSVVVLFNDDNTPMILPSSDLIELPNVEKSLKRSINSDSKQINKIIAKVQSLLINHINNRWGVFSRSVIDLLPHQLWVCNQVLRKWPVNYLVADDVGLGKTIEAGLIIWGLKEARNIKRILILTPASLTEQWQKRLSELFDLRFNIYRRSNDNDAINFWDTNKMIIVSAPTIQMANNQNQIDRQNKLFEADPWDLVIVDEAHHMNAASKQAPTLEYQLFTDLQDAHKIISTVLFTGTPHRGFDYNFWMLMKLLSPEDFDPEFEPKEMYEKLSNFFIRNNKANTVDMNNNLLFHGINQHPCQFSYTPEETQFYNKMTDFIKTGKAYAQTLDAQEITRVQLVLIQLQKIASSSILAVKHALITRRNNLLNAEQNINAENSSFENDLFSEDDLTETPEIKNKIQDYRFTLMEDEVKNLNELISLADAVKEESRINKIIEIIENDFSDRNILFFTEYIYTQSLLLSALMKKYGTECVTFINGQGRINNVEMPDGTIQRLDKNRYEAAAEFNNGEKRFLISTEAAGEGIDLQDNCYTLIHVDLPWNPMRLHQRVGRINRYGQKKSVDVVTLRNPETVESLVWDKLENKLNSIQHAFSAGMGNPEDMMEIVLGMHGDSFYNDIFSESFEHTSDFSDWFDAKTQTFGNQNTIDTVQNLVGHANKFNRSGLKDVPKLDLPDLIPFYKRILKNKGKRLTYDKDTDSWSFNTPEDWMDYGIDPFYEGLLFRRQLQKGEKPKSVCGVGHKIFDKGLEYSSTLTDYTCYINGTISYFIYKLYDMRTDEDNFDAVRILVIKYDSSLNKTESISLDVALKEINLLKADNLDETKKHIVEIPKSVEEIAKHELDKYHFILPSYDIQAVLSGEKE